MALGDHLDGIAERDWTPTATGRLRVAVVGLGWWAREYALPALEAARNCQATIAVSGSAEKREVAAREWGLAEALDYRDYADGRATDEYDAVYVCTPNTTHLEHVEAAARHGKAVLCEKPMAVDVDRGATLVAACEDADVPLMVAYRLQTDPATRRLRDIVQGEVLGTPLQIHGHMSQPLLEMGDEDGGWRLDPDLVGPGASVTDLGIYPLNTARFLLGQDPERVAATTDWGTAAFSDVGDEEATFTLEFPSGATAQCSVSQNAQLSGHLQVVGTEGSLVLDGAFFGNERQHLRVHRGEETATATWTPGDQMREVFAHFADRVLDDEPVGPDGEHALVDVATIEAIYEAAERDRWVPVGTP